MESLPARSCDGESTPCLEPIHPRVPQVHWQASFESLRGPSSPRSDRSPFHIVTSSEAPSHHSPQSPAQSKSRRWRAHRRRASVQCSIGPALNSSSFVTNRNAPTTQVRFELSAPLRGGTELYLCNNVSSVGGSSRCLERINPYARRDHCIVSFESLLGRSLHPTNRLPFLIGTRSEAPSDHPPQ
jgi:hypothetical protein